MRDRRVKGCLLRQNPCMGVSYMVRGRTEAVCRDRLERLCAALGAVPTMLPSARFGDGWVARAVERDTAPAGEGQGREG
jgi:hypothetical protein